MQQATQQGGRQRGSMSRGNAGRGRIVRACCYSILAVAVAAALPVGGAAAQTSAAEATVRFDIPAGDLAAALDKFSTQSGIQLLYRNDLVAGKRAKRVSGTLGAQRALQRLLEGSGVTFERTDAQTWVLKSAPTAPARARNNRAAAGTAASEEQRITQLPEIMVQGTRTLNMDIERTADDIQPYVVFRREEIRNSGAVSIADFLSKNLTTAGGTSGVPGSASGGASSGALGNNVSKIALRGLPYNQTLILIDGRRAPPRAHTAGSVDQADLNGIPLGAVERIEVLSASASGIYGGSATGGVINVVLRRDYQGLETTFTYDDTFHGGGMRQRLDVAGGFSLEGGKTSVMLVGSWQEGATLRQGERDFVRRAYRHISSVDPDYFSTAANPPLGATTNICAATATIWGTMTCDPAAGPLTLKPEWGGGSLGSSITHVPYGYAGVAGDNGVGLVSAAGSYNLDLARTSQTAGAYTSLLNEPEVKSLNLNLRRQFTSHLDVYLDLAVSENRGTFYVNGATTNYALPASSAANPFQQDIAIATPGFGLDQFYEFVQKDRRAVLGAIYAFDNGWRMSLDLSRGRARGDSSSQPGFLDGTEVLAIRNGVDGTGNPFDVFRDTNVYPVDFSGWMSASSGIVQLPSVLDSRNAALRLAGPLPWSLPGGAPTLSMLLEDRKEAVGDTGTDFPGVYRRLVPGRHQTIHSAYIEASLPLFSERNELPGVRKLDVQLAARRDDYRSEGVTNSILIFPNLPIPAVDRMTREFTSIDHTIGLRWQPLRDLTLRGSVATGFLPPNLTQLVPGTPSVANFGYLGMVDPKRGNEPVNYAVEYRSGGNPDLRPEQSRSHTVGLIWTPQWAEGLRFSADWVRTRKFDNAAFPPIGQISLNAEDHLAGYITRGPASDGFSVGRIIAIDASVRNMARQEVEAIDIAVDGERSTELGRFGFQLAATRNLHHIVQTVATMPEEERAGTMSARPWHANMEMYWERNAWRVQWSTHYLDSYCFETGCTTNFAATQLLGGSRMIPSQTYHDVVVRWQAPLSVTGLLADTEVLLGVKNVFDREPPFYPQLPFFDVQGDPRLSSWFVTLTKRF